MLTRRDLLMQCAALGVLQIGDPLLSVADAVSALDAQERSPTQWNEIGPFYKEGGPAVTQLRRKGDAGLPLAVAGTVFDTRGNVLPGAKIEIWQADHHGLYDLDGFHYRATLTGDRNGHYGFESVMPGHYPARTCQHIHYLITAPGHKPLITQLYFATDSVFEGDPDRNFTRDPLVLSRELVRPVVLSGDPKMVQAAVSFDVVLERL